MPRKRDVILDTLTKQFDHDKTAAQEARGQQAVAEPPPEARDESPAPELVRGGYALPSINGIAFGGQGRPGYDWKPDSLADTYGADPTQFIRVAKNEMEKLELQDRDLYAQLDKAQSVNSRRNIERKLDASHIAWQRLAWLANPDIDGEPLTIQCRTQTPLGRCERVLWRTEIAVQAGRCLSCINTLYHGRK